MDPNHAYCYFFDDDTFLETDRPGFRRRVITGEHLQLCFWRIDGGATGLLPAPPHRQRAARHRRARRSSTSGSATTTTTRSASCSARATSTSRRRDVWHGDSVFIGDDEYDECWILDVFAPPRADLVDGTAP